MWFTQVLHQTSRPEAEGVDHRLIPQASVPDSRITKGMTLIEILIVITVIGAIMAITAPGFNSMRRQLRLESGAQQLIGDLHLARVGALMRNTPVFLAKTSASTYEIRFAGSFALPAGIVFGANDPDTVWFAAFGPALTGSAVYDLAQGSARRQVRLNPAGFAQ